MSCSRYTVTINAKLAPALAGGEYTHDELGTVTLKFLEEGIYEITELNLFSNSVGWISVIKDSKYADLDNTIG